MTRREPKQGDQFRHRRQIDRDRNPEVCTVTRVTSTAVYFRNSTGFKSVVDRSRLGEAVSEWLSVSEPKTD